MAAGPANLPWLNYDEVRAAADEFRTSHGYDDEVAYPIERVVDVVLGLDIVPLPGLYRQFRINGYLTPDRSAIYVDADLPEVNETNYRLTLTHELAHLVLHEGVWERLSCDSIAEWRRVLASVLSDEEYDRMEWQAHAFAGCLLVPDRHLAPTFRCEAADVEQRLPSYRGKLAPQTVFDICLDAVCQSVAERFIVHPRTVAIQLDRGPLPDEFAAHLFGPSHGLETKGRMRDRF